MYKFKVKTRIEKSGKFIMGDGRKKLLKLIDKEGSLRKAAKKMHISYRHAWGMVQETSKATGRKIVKTVRGGSKGGKTILTKTGKDLVRKFEEKTDVIEQTLKYGRKPALTTDGIIINKGKILLIKRKNPPFKGYYALPGGFVEYGESTEDAVVREIKEETSLNAKVKRLIGVYSKMGRDPRGHIVTVVYELTPKSTKASPRSDASEAKFFPLNKLPELAFDHMEPIVDYLKIAKK
ncbi:MAG: NUDIX domain-containing protein [Thermoplasmata archaeon]